MAEQVLHPNAHLLHKPGFTQQAHTPALVLDLDALEANIRTLAAHCADKGVVVRPHIKSHKSLDIAERQRQAGATGFCCARIAEAETMVRAGYDDILITSPVVSAHGIARVLALQPATITMACDNEATAARIGAMAAAHGCVLPLCMDLDVGTRRTGIRPDGAADALAARIRAHPNLRLWGVQAYAGHLMHLPEDERRAATVKVHALLKRWREVADLAVTGGGTGTWRLDTAAGSPFTELQAGSYVFMDADYRDALGYHGVPFANALTVATRVISLPGRRAATVDAGLKSFATDAGIPVPTADGATPAPGLSYAFTGDEHGVILADDPAHRLPLDTVVRCLGSHCDPTVNLYDWFHCVRGDRLVALWRVHARGAADAHTTA